MRLVQFFAWMTFGGVVIAAQADEVKLQGYSKSYAQCMQLSASNPSKAEKCIKAELKIHEKQLEKNLKAYKKANPNHAQHIQQQYKFWQQQVQQQCQVAKTANFGRLQREQCALNMVMSQANLYASRLMNNKSNS